MFIGVDYIYDGKTEYYNGKKCKVIDYIFKDDGKGEIFLKTMVKVKFYDEEDVDLPTGAEWGVLEENLKEIKNENDTTEGWCL